jgi:hypothetical protein
MTILDYMMNALSVRELHEIPGVLTYGSSVPYGCRNSGINSYDVYIYKRYKVKRTNGCAFLV